MKITNFPKETVIINQNVMYFPDFTTQYTDSCGGRAELHIRILLEGQFPKNAEETDFSQNEFTSKAAFNSPCTVATWAKVTGKQLEKERLTNLLLENNQKTFWHRVLGQRLGFIEANSIHRVLTFICVWKCH